MVARLCMLAGRISHKFVYKKGGGNKLIVGVDVETCPLMRRVALQRL